MEERRMKDAAEVRRERYTPGKSVSSTLTSAPEERVRRESAALPGIPRCASARDRFSIYEDAAPSMQHPHRRPSEGFFLVEEDVVAREPFADKCRFKSPPVVFQPPALSGLCLALPPASPSARWKGHKDSEQIGDRDGVLVSALMQRLSLLTLSFILHSKTATLVTYNLLTRNCKLGPPDSGLIVIAALLFDWIEIALLFPLMLSMQFEVEAPTSCAHVVLPGLKLIRAWLLSRRRTTRSFFWDQSLMLTIVIDLRGVFDSAGPIRI
ncbi:hypothetical protein K438DRAFT_1779400 [Mycena galopus ATCC 62051]|nr:hypothetical protein K438DRAFT_1779400 [Mycena galopus ATCC 62051]